MNPLEPIALRAVSLADMEALQAAAQSDDHPVIAPTVAMTRGHDFVGYASIGQIPTVIIWLHSQKVRARESYRVLREVEALASQHGPQLIMPCARTSPFHPYLPRLGYTALGHADWLMKTLNPG